MKKEFTEEEKAELVKTVKILSSSGEPFESDVLRLYNDREIILDRLFSAAMLADKWIPDILSGLRMHLQYNTEKGMGCMNEKLFNRTSELIEFLTNIISNKGNISVWIDEVCDICEVLHEYENKSLF
jgi:hypothetical protein